MIPEDYDRYSSTQFAELLRKALFDYYEALVTKSPKFFYIEGIDPLDGKSPGESIRELYIGLKSRDARNNFVHGVQKLLEEHLHAVVAEMLEEVILVIFDLCHPRLLVPLVVCVCKRTNDSLGQTNLLFSKVLLVLIRMQDQPTASEELQKAVKILKASEKFPISLRLYLRNELLLTKL